MVTIAEFHESFLKAEEDIKLAELFIDGLSSAESTDGIAEHQPRGIVIPAINELRYAAKHLLEAMQEGVSSEIRQEQITRASRHCVRARLDALRALILYLVRDFHQFTNLYRLSNVSAEDRERFHKTRVKGRVKKIDYRTIFGTNEQVQAALKESKCSRKVNTSFIERHNGTDRNRCSRKVRKSYCFSKDWDVHRAATCFSMYSYNFCWQVRTLRRPDGQKGGCTPAMSAELTDHVWTITEWLNYPACQC